jgi:hypothetical protein
MSFGGGCGGGSGNGDLVSDLEGVTGLLVDRDNIVEESRALGKPFEVGAVGEGISGRGVEVDSRV